MTAEDLLALHLDELGVEYVRQFLYIPGRKFKADFAIPAERLLIEVQGGVYSRQAHGSVTGVILDNERLNLAMLHRWRLLRFTPDDVNRGKAKKHIAAVIEWGEPLGGHKEETWT